MGLSSRDDSSASRVAVGIYICALEVCVRGGGL